MKIGLEWSKMASNATLSHLKLLAYSLGGMPPDPPSFIYIDILLHSIYISAYIHLYYHYTGICLIDV